MTMDSSPEAIELQRKIQASLSGEQRLALAFEMSEALRELALCRLRAEHPDLSEPDLMLLLAQIPWSDAETDQSSQDR